MNIERPKSKQPLPDNAKLVFKGAMFEVYQWEQEMFNGTKKIYEKLKRPDSVIVFAVSESGKIILTKQEQSSKAPFVAGAGGRVERGEEILTAAMRELREETGYEANEFVLWKAVQPISRIEWAVYVFIAHGAKKTSEQSLGASERIQVMEVDFDEFLKLALQDNFYQQEIYRDIVEATLDEVKKEELKTLFKAGL